METYQAARQRLLGEFTAMGFKTSNHNLKVPWVEFPFTSGKYKIYFRPQAVYLNGHSMFIDMRGISAHALLEHIKREVNT